MPAGIVRKYFCHRRMKMKKSILFSTVVAAFFGLILSGCASTKILTPGAIEDDIDGIPYLEHCQFFISEDVTLKFLSDNRETVHPKLSGGTVRAERTIIRRTIKISKSTPGILRTKNNAGDVLVGYDSLIHPNEREQLNLYLLFDDDNDNVIKFATIYDIKDRKFAIVGNEVDYGGVIYTITYKGNEKPYLMYKFKERTKKQNEARTVRGRKVGS
jgi:hypothetical protein